MELFYNGNKQYILSFPKPFITQLFPKIDVKVSEKISIFYRSRNSFNFHQMQNINCNKWVFNNNALVDSIYYSNTEYTLILNGYDSVILQDLDEEFIDKFNELTKDKDKKIIIAGSDIPLTNEMSFDFEIGGGISNYFNYCIIFGLTKDVIPFIQRVHNYKLNEIKRDIKQVQEFANIYNMAILENNYRNNIDCNNNLFTTIFEKYHSIIEWDGKFTIKFREKFISPDLVFLRG